LIKAERKKEMITHEEVTLSQNEAEIPPAASETPIPVDDKPDQPHQSHPWGYFIAGMSLTLLAVALGAVLGYLARPALDPATPASAAITTAVAGPVAVRAPLAATPPPQAPATLTDIVQAGGHSKGSPDAPVVIVEYSDFQCPFCGRHAREVEGRLEETYVKTGQVRLVYKHFAILGSESVWAAVASECAADQNKFWEYHDLLFSRQSGENQGAFNQDKLKAFAAELGLDMTIFNECFEAQKHLDVVQANSTEARQLGMRGTPGFFANGVAVVGAQPFEAFQQVIEEQLKAANQ
jgi:protein-disulfide isomerase